LHDVVAHCAHPGERAQDRIIGGGGCKQNRDRCYDFKNISAKNGKTLAFLTLCKAKLCKNGSKHWFLRKVAIFRRKL
jgi:hypothetical protein